MLAGRERLLYIGADPFEFITAGAAAATAHVCWLQQKKEAANEARSAETGVLDNAHRELQV